MTENNAWLTESALMDLEKQVQRDIPRFGPNVHIGVRAGLLREMLSKLRAPVAEVQIGVGVTEQGATVCLMQPHADGSATVIYSETHPIGDSLGRAALASAPVAGEAQEPVAWLHQCRKKPELATVTMNKREPALAAKGYRPIPLYAAPQASEAKPYFSQCVLHGPAPEGFADWFQWLEAPVKMGAFIRAATAADWKRTEDALRAPEALGERTQSEKHWREHAKEN